LHHLILRQEDQVIAIEQPTIDQATKQRKMGRPGGDEASGKRFLEQVYEPDGSCH
jgi:hypothetical protein